MGFFDFLRKKPAATEVTYSGGSGSSMEDAVVVTATSTMIGVPAEYDYVAMQCGRESVDWKGESQSLLDGAGGKSYDLLVVRLKDGTTREFYFDITSFFGKL